MEIAPPLPRVGIALAVYRPDIEHFKAQLDSIKNQAYGNWFCVLTSDSPLSELRHEPELDGFFEDARFTWKQNKTRLGFKLNFSRAIQEVLSMGAEFIACSDQDDVWYPEKLVTCIATISSKPKMSVVHSDMDLIADGIPLRESAWMVERRGVNNAGPSALLIRNVATGASMLMDAELARKYPKVPDEVDFHDYWYALAASFNGGVHPIRKRLYAYRQHHENVVGVVPYLGLIGASSRKSWLKLPEKSKKSWQKTRNLALSCERAGLPLTFFQKLAFLWPYDLGLGLLGYGFFSILKDRPVARQCFIGALGKLLFFVKCRG